MPSRAGGKRHAMGIRRSGSTGVEVGARLTADGIRVILTAQGKPLLDFRVGVTGRPGPLRIAWPDGMEPSDALRRQVETRVRSVLGAVDGKTRS